jgi:hypothetical protein
MTEELGPIRPTEEHNYVAFFLTLACNLCCPYCINLHSEGSRSHQAKRQQLGPDQWIQAANRLELRDDLPLTLQGGEPTLHPGFYRLVNEVKPEIKMDLMTNLMFDVEAFIANVPAWRFTREAPYASIRVSYHPGQNDINDLIRKTVRLQDAGFRIGLYGIEHPDPGLNRHIQEVRERCLTLGLDFRTKEFLGEHNGVMHGTFKYDGCVGAQLMKRCDCRTTELIAGPTGEVYRCHSDLYRGRESFEHILDPGFSEKSIEKFRTCDWHGDCNPCDVKVKTNRFQIFGHTSVEMLDIRPIEES